MLKYFTVRMNLDNEFENFAISSDPLKFEIYPNTRSQLKMGINYHVIGFQVSFAPDFLPGNGDDLEKGKTNTFTVNSYLNMQHLLVDLKYGRTRGYFLNNTNDYLPNWQHGDPYIQFPNLNLTDLHIKVGYSSNKKFSFQSIRTQTERQLRSAGTFTPFFSYRYFNPDDRTELVTSNQTSQESFNHEVIFSLGYHHTFVRWQSFFVTLGAHVGYGFQRSQIQTRSISNSITTRQNNPLMKLSGMFGLGYNGERFFSGLYLQDQTTNYQEENSTTRINDSTIQYNLFIGYRFNAPKKVEAFFKRHRK